MNKNNYQKNRNNVSGDAISGLLYGVVGLIAMLVILPTFGFILAIVAIDVSPEAVCVFAALSLFFDVVVYLIIRKKDVSKGVKIAAYSAMALITSISLFMLMVINGALS